MPTDNYF